MDIPLKTRYTGGMRALRAVVSALGVAGFLLPCVGQAALSVKVWPDKLRVKPGEPVRLAITVSGLPAGQAAEVTCRVATGVDTVVARFSGKTDEKGVASFTFTPQAEWGYGVTAEGRNGAESATGYEAFACAQNPYMVSPAYTVPEVYGQDTLPDGAPAPVGPAQNPYLQKAIRDQVAKLRDQYVTVGELMGPAFCSFSSIKPPVDNYFKGYHYNYSGNGVRGVIQALHENGISSVIYVNACLSGLAGTEFARRHPEYLVYSPDGAPFAEVTLKSMAAHQEYVRDYPASLARTVKDPQYREKVSGDYPGFLNAVMDFRDERLSEIGADKILEGQKYFGYDGVRFDGHYAVPSIGDPLAPSFDFRDYRGAKQATGKAGEDLTARNMGRAYEIMRKGNPDFLIGLNYADYRSDAAGDRILRSPVGKVVSPGNWILDEVAKGALSPAAPENRWSEFIRLMGEQADRVRKADNYLFAGWGGGPGENPVDTKQVMAVSYASGLRWICGGWKRIPGNPARYVNDDVKHQYAQFAMRYSEFVLNNRLERIPAAEVAKSATMRSSRPLFWDRFGFRLRTPQTQYLVWHLINQPLEEALTTDAKEPPPAENVTLELGPELLPPTAKPETRQAFVLSPDSDTQLVRVTCTVQKDRISIAVPRVLNWSVLVIAP